LIGAERHGYGKDQNEAAKLGIPQAHSFEPSRKINGVAATALV
jgi:hypothetical protein